MMSIALAVAGCADTPTAPTAFGGSSPAQALRTIPLDAFGIAAAFPTGGQACTAPEYRQFDFWLGKWDAHRTDNNALSGTDVITSRLGGCAIEESWVDGWRGRSLTSYDASTGKWTQFWVYTGGGFASPLLLEGGFADGAMTMEYVRKSNEGFFIPFPPVGVHYEVGDYYLWLADPSTGSVYQRDFRAFDGGPQTLAFLLRYDPVEEVTPIAIAPGGQCVSRPQNHEFDFMIGSWDIYSGRGTPNGKPQGQTTFSSDLGNCLVEEHSSEGPSYIGWSFNSWSLVTREWHRTYVDNAGHRIALKGGLAGDAMVMTGTQSAPGGDVTIRVTWRPMSPSQVIQTWDFSRDGGTTWAQHREFTYIKR
jgi:hypothetical protein